MRLFADLCFHACVPFLGRLALSSAPLVELLSARAICIKSSRVPLFTESVPFSSSFENLWIRSSHSKHTKTPTMSKTEAEHGAWRSPISGGIAAGSGIQFMGLERDSSTSASSDSVYWIEQRPSEGGRNVICSWEPATAKILEWTPEGFSAKTKVHEYGGGAFCVFKGSVFFTNKTDQRIYSQAFPADPPSAVTKVDSARRFADLHYSEHYSALFAVCEDNGVREDDEHHEKVEDGCKTKTVPDNYIVAINPETGDLTCTVEGADFYARPLTSRTGQLVWMEWNMPNMPWDCTSVKWSDLSTASDRVDSKTVRSLNAKNGKSDVAFTFPSFTSSGDILYVSDEENWGNLYVRQVTRSPMVKQFLSQTENHNEKKLCLDRQNQDLGYPHWIFGMHPYSDYSPPASGNTTIVFSYGKNLISLDFDKEFSITNYKSLTTGFRFHTYYVQTVPRGVYAIGYDAKTPSTLFFHEFVTGEVKKVRVSSDLDLEGYLSEPQDIEFPTGKGEVAFGYFYPPVNKDFTAPQGQLPPLLVKMHGGPTSESFAMLSPKTQFYTSRGFAVLDVNYRGSTGHGREYRQKLNLNWGVSDVEDAVNGAKYLVDKGLVDKKRLCITGGSAGGLSVLNALLHHDTFTAGASQYGVTDLEALVADTHKFELRYLDVIIGEYPAQKKVYEERSPILHKDKLKCPVIFFQGLEDHVVPPSQSEKMYEVVKAKGLPCAYVTFEGEGHGFAKKENIEKALVTECAFFIKVFGIEGSSLQCEVPIENLKS